SSPYNLTGLLACSDYEIRLQAICSSATDTSTYTAPTAFETDGCCVSPDSVAMNTIAETNVDASWPSILAAVEYNIRYKEIGSSVWTELLNVISPLNIPGLNGCTNYEIQVQTVCAGSVTTAYSSSTTFETPGCGACLDLTYCPSSGDEAEFE